MWSLRIRKGEKDLFMEGKPDNRFKDNLLLILIGVAFFVALSHLSVVWENVWSVISLFMPLIVGGIIAFKCADAFFSETI